jgi:hypothetical protein
MGAGADGRAPSAVYGAAGAPPENLFLVCSYNEASKLAHTPAGAPAGVGVYTVALDTDSGRLRAVDAVPAGPNPAFALQHPTLPVVYASTERIDDDGEVMAFALGGPEARGALRLLSKRSAVRGQPRRAGLQPRGLLGLCAPADAPAHARLRFLCRAARAPASCTCTRRSSTCWWSTTGTRR